ncbi:MAG: HRDC domain-containing protein, partial [Candidatus Phocaeicola faecipullorum]|nr:HRDC domain-containing protein [Candidatus Phocaeicola faecipullorum]
MHYSLLDSDIKVKDAVDHFINLERIAVDFEGEFNLHIYGEHLCLIQIFDGKDFFIIDPRSKEVSEKGLSLFFSSPVKKVWFDSQSDASLVYKKYGMRIENIYDIKILGMVLGFTGNLIAMEEKYLGLHKDVSKKKNQQSNWLIRPLPDSQIEYALEDVAHLLDLEDVLNPLVASADLDKKAAALMKKAAAVKKSEPGWKKIGNWKMLSFEEKVYTKHLFIARDNIARRFNVPAVRVMNKHLIAEFAKKRPSSEKELRERLSGENPRFFNIL